MSLKSIALGDRVDWNSLPDLLAFAALAVVFSSLLPRKADSNVRLWLAAWVLIVIHFIAKFSDASGIQFIPRSIVSETLVLAALAFMWAAVARRMTWRGFLVFAALGIPQLAYIEFTVFDGVPLAYYVAAIVLGFTLPVFAIARVVPRRSDRFLAIGACATLSVSLLLVIRYNSDPSNGWTNIMTWLYLCAGILQWRRAEVMSTGTITTIGGFFAWASIFPIGFAMYTWVPSIHIDESAYNIPKYIVAIGIILTLFEEQMERSNFLAHHDELTGLPNRRMLLERLASAIDRARRGGTKMGLLTIDLNSFKAVNDSYGHNAGDELLRVVARRFAGRLRSTDICSRVGGDEFVVLAEQLVTRADAECLVRDLLEALEEPVVLGDASTRARASIGIAMFPEDGSDAEELLAFSDASMYAAKRGPTSHDRRAETRAS